MTGYPWSEVRALPPGHYITVRGTDGRTGLATHDDGIYPAARRVLDGKDTAADRAQVAEWLDEVVPQPEGQLALWQAAA